MKRVALSLDPEGGGLSEPGGRRGGPEGLWEGGQTVECNGLDLAGEPLERRSLVLGGACSRKGRGLVIGEGAA